MTANAGIDNNILKKGKHTMYTVKELIEALSQCPENYAINIAMLGAAADVEQVGIDHNNETVVIFGK